MSASKSLLKFIGLMSDEQVALVKAAIEKTTKDLKDFPEIHKAYHYENLHQWELAAEIWKKIGKTQDADMCIHIAKRIKERK